MENDFWLNYEIIDGSRGENPHCSLWTLYYMKKKAVTISPSQLIGFLDQELNELPDNRKGDNKKYAVKDAVMAAFSVFFTQSPSFLEHQSLMKQKKGKDNAQSLFGLSAIPCDNQIRNLLDPISAKTVFGTFKTVYKWLEKHRIINKFKYLDNQILLACLWNRIL